MKKLSNIFKRIRYLYIVILLISFFFNSCRTSLELTEDKSTGTEKQIDNKKISQTNIPIKLKYYLHKKIKTTYFFIGEKDIYKSGVIDNGSSAWTKYWIKTYGGIDNPDRRNGYFPEYFIPKENPFYFALPYNDVTDHGHKISIKNIKILKEWEKRADSQNNNGFVSYCNNRWIKITYTGKVCYAQWEDVGPFKTDDVTYVFGTARPKNKINGGVGLDISPACFKYLGMKDNNYTNWQFIDFEDVPNGPWLKYITTSNPRWY